MIDLADVVPILPRAYRRLVLALIAAEAEMVAGEREADIAQCESWRRARLIVTRAIDEALAPFKAEILDREEETRENP